MTDTTHTEIATQAYLLWLQDGMSHGRAEQHWIAAERLVSKAKIAPRKPRKKKLNS